MDLLTISYRTTIVYFVVLIAIRVMGKREVGKLTVFGFGHFDHVC